jgi:glyoxylase I family protein
MTVQRLSHLGICVADLEKSKTFYREVFGYEQVGEIVIGSEADALLDLKRTQLDAIYLKRTGEDTRLELLYFRSPGYETNKEVRAVNLTGITHLSFRTSNAKETTEKAKQYGGQLIENSITDNLKFGFYACMITDPDGTRIELLQAPGDPNALPGQS